MPPSGDTSVHAKPKPFNCGNCHTTGWRHQDDTLHNLRQDGLAGFDGTFTATGIECEACHGAGSKHAIAPSKLNITKVAVPRTTAQLQAHGAGYGLPVHCGECHTRDGERDYPTYMSGANTAGWTGDAKFAGGAPIGGRIQTSGDFIQHHEQYDEIIGINPDTMTTARTAMFAATHGDCSTCHKPHPTTHHEGDPVNGGFPTPSLPGIHTDCQACHTAAKYTLNGHVGGAGPDKPAHCIDCHMPYLAKSALVTRAATPGGAPPEGDVSSHLFGIDLSKDPATEKFTADGKFAYPWITGLHVCGRCHASDSPRGGGGAPVVVLNFNSWKGVTVHN